MEPLADALDARLNRRQLMARLLLSAAAAIGAPSLGLGAKPDDNWTPQVFTPAQNDTLTAIGDRIIPGSAAAKCNRVIDLVMTVETSDVRDQLLQSLDAFDNSADGQFGKPFRDLPVEQQDAVLAREAEHTAKTDPFGVLKEWMADAYWSSQDGLRELGWNGQMARSGYAACDRHRDS